MLIDVPLENRGAALALGRYYPIIVETDAELAELDRFLEETRSQPTAPDLLDRRPSQLWSPNVLISRYEPPLPGWPWLCVVRWPEPFVQAAIDQDVEMARGCYSMAAFQEPDEVDAHCIDLLENLGTCGELSVRLLTADRIGSGGHA